MDYSIPLPPTPTLDTPRLVLRPLELSDAPLIQRRFSHWEIVRWLSAVVPWPYPIDGAEIYAEECLQKRARNERLYWVLCLRGRLADPIGGIDLWPENGSQSQRGFWLGSEWHGRGLMTEAAQRVTQYAFTDLHWDRLWLSNAQSNQASRRIKEKQGAALVNQVPKQYVSGPGVEEIWLLKRDEWSARYETVEDS